MWTLLIVLVVMVLVIGGTFYLCRKESPACCLMSKAVDPYAIRTGPLSSSQSASLSDCCAEKGKCDPTAVEACLATAVTNNAPTSISDCLGATGATGVAAMMAVAAATKMLPSRPNAGCGPCGGYQLMASGFTLPRSGLPYDSYPVRNAMCASGVGPRCGGRDGVTVHGENNAIYAVHADSVHDPNIATQRERCKHLESFVPLMACSDVRTTQPPYLGSQIGAEIPEADKDRTFACSISSAANSLLGARSGCGSCALSGSAYGSAF